MGVISAHNDITFESPKRLISRVKRALKSFNQAGLLDENDFYESIMFVLDKLGIGGLIEEQAVIDIKNKKGLLPENFKTLYVATLCDISSAKDNPHMQNGYVFYTDTTYENVAKDGCKITCADENCKQKITVREYVQGLERIHNYDMKHMLDIVPVNDNMRDYQIAINDKYIHTGFKDGVIYIKYYAYPIDLETGLPLVPTTESIQKAIEYYIIYETFLNFYWNDEVPNGISQKASQAKQLYEDAVSQAIWESKLPTFMGLIDSIRLKRKSLDIYKQIDRDI